jgi:hypothetical protein
MELDSPDWYTAVRDLVVFAPGSQRGHQATVNMSCINSLVAPDFFKVNRLDIANAALDLSEPLLKAQESHSTALKAFGF